MNVARCHDRAALRDLLNQDAFETAYALGDLEPAMFAYSEFWAGEVSGTLQACVLFYRGFEIPTLTMFGPLPALRSILDTAPLPPAVFCMFHERYLALVRDYYNVPQLDILHRMTITPNDYHAPHTTYPEIRRLGAEDTPALNHLYQQQMAGEKAGAAFTPLALENGCFVGLEEGGELIAAAGTHVLSRAENVAAIGNVFTLPRLRGKGLATHVTAAVTSQIFEMGISRVVLNVMRNNLSAIRVYEKLGYRIHSPVIEGDAQGIQPAQ